MGVSENIEIKEGVDQETVDENRELVARINTAGKLILRWSMLQKASIQYR